MRVVTKYSVSLADGIQPVVLKESNNGNFLFTLDDKPYNGASVYCLNQAKTVLENLEQQQWKESLKLHKIEEKKRLSSCEELVLFFLLLGVNMSATGRILSLSRDRVRQIRDRALRKLNLKMIAKEDIKAKIDFDRLLKENEDLIKNLGLKYKH